MELKQYLQQPYSGRQSFLQQIVFPMFGEELFEDAFDCSILKEIPDLIPTAQTTGIRDIKHIGHIDMDFNPINIFDITVASQVQMARNRIGIQRVVRRIMDTYSSSFMIFHYEDKGSWEWRFTFCYKGANKDSTTDGKRFTFLLGPGQNCRTAAENFQKIIDKHDVGLKDIVEAFSVEALNKEFFDKYREHYADFVQYITGKRYVKQGGKWIEKLISEPHVQLMAQFIGDEKRVRDYIKKLLGRIVFLHYLQRKGWLGVPDGKNWGEGDTEFMQHLLEFATPEQKENFVEVVLEPLFYGALNTDRTVEGDLFNTRINFPEIGATVRIPYLNGGLFEQDENDLLTVKFPSEYFSRLLDFFSQYNFTIDENDPNDAQVGVDPEMLGRIFESLLEDNKEKGAYYTPKEIVQYMCRESLIAYLQTDIDDQSEACQAIADFVRSNDADCLLKYEGGQEIHNLSSIVLERLKEVKICDPAIGSGAFPMGLLRELYHCRIALEELSVTPSEIKSQIIKNNIYGVDIEQGAVDIARLRFWLSLIVDEDMPHPLPNLDYKIMQGNSLLESYKGHDLSKILDSSNIIYPQETELYLQFADDESSTNQILLRRKLEAYYGCHDSEEKQYLKNEIKDIINRQIESFRLERGVQRALHEEVEAQRKKVAEQEVLDISNIDIMGNPYFFLWHTWFDDVFNRPSGRNGFDIVIGNPPYLRIQGIRDVNPEMANTLVRSYQSATASFDLYVIFIELGLSIITEEGLVNYIAPVKWSNASFGKGLRKLLCDQMAASQIINFGDSQVFNASTYSGIQRFRKKSEQLEYVQLKSNLTTSNQIESFLSRLSKDSFSFINYKTFNDNPWTLTSGKGYSILNKLRQQPLTLSDIFEKVYQGIATSKDDVFFLYDSCYISEDIIEGYSKYHQKRVQVEVGLLKPLLKGEDVHRYDDIKTDRYVIFPYKLEDTRAFLYEENELLTCYPLGYAYLKSCEKALRAREKGRFNLDKYWFQFSRGQGITNGGIPKLLAPEISFGGNFAYDRMGQFYHTTTVYGYIKRRDISISYETLMTILNSTICWWYLTSTGSILANGYFRYKPAYLKAFPIPHITKEIDLKIQDLIKSKEQNSIELKQLICSLYSLSEEDISIIYG